MNVLLTEDDYPFTRACNRTEAIQLASYLGEHVETGKLNRKNYTLRCKNTDMEEILGLLESGANDLNIGVSVNDKVFIATVGENDVFVKF